MAKLKIIFHHAFTEHRIPYTTNHNPDLDLKKKPNKRSPKTEATLFVRFLEIVEIFFSKEPNILEFC